jgi:hypothetical protein
MKTLSTLFLLFIGSALFAGNADEALKKLNVKPEFHYETPFNHQCFKKISDATVLFAGLTYFSSEADLEIFSSSQYFLITGDEIGSYNTAHQLFNSPKFFNTIRNDFKIKNQEDAAIFQDLLYLIDQRSSWTSYFKQNNDWYFIRKTFFEDIEAWKVSTDSNGTITAIEYGEKMAVTIPDEVYETDYPSTTYEEQEAYTLNEAHLQQIQDIISKEFIFNESAIELTDENLSIISDALFYEFAFTIEQEVIDEEYGNYISSINNVFTALAYMDKMKLYYSFNEMVESPQFIESIKPSFTLKGQSDALVFEAILDAYSGHMNSKKMIYQKDDVWYFIRDESFGEKEGFAVNVDANGKMVSIRYSSNLEIDIPEEEFDEATADWGFHLLLPESNSLEIVEGSSVNYVLEFNEKPVRQMGAWVLTTLNGQNLGMDAGSEIYSPVYGDILSSELPLGRHTVDFYLMRPGMDIETALGKASVEINVVPFNDEGVTWNFVMDEPKSNTVKSKTGESVPVAFTFNAEQANRLGVRLDIYFEGQLVGGQKAPYLQSPFQTNIPGSEMKKGINKVEFVFAGGSKELAGFEVNVEVE